MSGSIIHFRPYQQKAFLDRTTGLQVWFWSRQIGKSFTGGAWAVDRLLTQLRGYDRWLVTVLSNSKDNGAEFNLKCAEVCQNLGKAYEQEELSPDTSYENMIFETRVTMGKKVGRIKVLAANPRTARGFSGDLVMDEFAFHENSQQIWEAAEPILSANPEFLCRIMSTANGKHNMFYQMVSSGQYPVLKVTRTDAWKQGLKIYHPVTRQPITPAEARELALDKRAYDQNYECLFSDENMALLTYELIGAAEQEGIGVICAQDWSSMAIELMRAAAGDLYLGVDVGRHRDLTVMTVMEKLGPLYLVKGILRIENMRLPDQQRRLGVICALPKFRKACIDMTGLGLGLCEYAQDEYGLYRVQGINFAATVPTTTRLAIEGRKAPSVRVTEAMATELLQVYEDRAIKHPHDAQLREDLRKPERIVTPGGRVSIAATRDAAEHADHFWSFALAVEAAGTEPPSFPPVPFHRGGARWEARRERSVLA